MKILRDSNAFQQLLLSDLQLFLKCRRLIGFIWSKRNRYENVSNRLTASVLKVEIVCIRVFYERKIQMAGCVSSKDVAAVLSTHIRIFQQFKISVTKHC